MRIYIVGSVASGKSTLAKKLSAKINIPYQSLDEFVHIPDKAYPSGNRKREIEEREMLFNSLIGKISWIVEDIGRPCFEDGLKAADCIVFLDIQPMRRNYRIINRWIKQRLGVEKCIYTPRLIMLIDMLRWSRDYDSGKDNLKARLINYKDKIITLHNKKQINEFLMGISENVLT